jgi:hypothetical protein
VFDGFLLARRQRRGSFTRTSTAADDIWRGRPSVRRVELCRTGRSSTWLFNGNSELNNVVQHVIRTAAFVDG